MKLELKNLQIDIEGKKVVSGANLETESGKICVLAGPNGSGKSSLAYAIAGHPSYTITGGKILLDGKNIISLEPEKRAELGLFLGFQSPPDVAGVGLFSYLREISQEKIGAAQFKEMLETMLSSLGLDKNFSDRYLNQGFSGGERKKSEVLQLILRNPKIAILDEPDSGLDVDGIRAMGQILQRQKKKGTGFLVITHHEKILDFLAPDKVYVMLNGKVAASGGKGLVKKIQKEGYSWLKGNVSAKRVKHA